jgi:NAD(P)-dependent dehydrogenase (short-subunit alcohol dehydrogenase family)
MTETALPTVQDVLPDGCVALITGAARGVGRACARRFAATGASVILVDRRADDLNRLARELQAAGTQGRSFVMDLASPEAIEKLALDARAAYGHLDILVNNAGVILPKGVLETSAEEWDRLMDVNLRAVFLLSRTLMPDLRKRRGCIVNVASTAGLRAQQENGPYCTAKSGVIMLTQALAQEVRRDGVRVNCVCPGAIDTPLLEEYARARGSSDAVDRLRAEDLLVPPDDIADAVLFLAGRQARSITGHALVVDRGALLV